MRQTDYATYGRAVRRVLDVRHRVICLLCLVTLVIGGCLPGTRAANPTEITVYGWSGYIPQSVLDAFTKRTGINVSYAIYEDQEDALERLREGAVFDVVVMSHDMVPRLNEEALIAEIDHRNIPNFKNVSVSFRDLATDPENRYSIPYQWGATGLIVHTGRMTEPVTRWADLWNPAVSARAGVWPLRRDLFGLTLQSLGYSYNDFDPEHLEAARRELDRLREQGVTFIDLELPHAADLILNGEIDVVVGWSYDYLEANAADDEVVFIYPEEGTILWLDTLIIPAPAPNKADAERFLNFILEPEIGAQIVNEIYVAVPNDAAQPLIDPEILGNRAVYPTPEDLRNAEFQLPIDPEIEPYYSDLWQAYQQIDDKN